MDAEGEDEGAADRGTVLSRLAQLGLYRPEARVYVELFVQGPAGAEEIADALGVHPDDGRWALEQLARRGLAGPDPHDPDRFVARPPEAILERTVEELGAEADAAEVAAFHHRLAGALEALRERARTGRAGDRPRDGGTAAAAANTSATGPGADGATYRILHGRAAVVEAAEEAMRAATDELLVFSINPWAHVSPESYPSLWTAGIDRARDGVTARAIFHTTDEMRELLVPVLLLDTVEIRHMEPDRHRPFILVDRERILYWLVTDPSTDPDADREVVVLSDAREFVDEHRELFETFWDVGRRMRVRPQDSRPGP